MAYIEFENVCKYYRMGGQTIAATDHISFTVERGELCVVVGPSGAGKTTLLNILGGMDSCDEGKIRLDGRVISALSERALTDYRRYDVGFVFQFYNLVQNLTAVENVELSKNPKIVLCDEPTGALDYQTGKTILKLLQDTCRQTGKTVIIITHNSALTQMADRVVRIRNGAVQRVEINASPMPVEQIEW